MVGGSIVGFDHHALLLYVTLSPPPRNSDISLIERIRYRSIGTTRTKVPSISDQTDKD